MQKERMDALLAHGVQHGASDIHFKAGDRPAYRIDGTLRPVKCDRLMPADTEAICANLLKPDVAPEGLILIQEHDASYSLDGVGRFRVNVYRQRGSLSCILRVIPREVPSIEGMQLPATVQELAGNERGMVLVTGATGSGKSTTLAAMIDHINGTRPVHILTIEDPIEYLHSNRAASVSQREVGPDTHDFKTALRAALRQDPDGHMVFSTVHTTDAAKTVNRLIGRLHDPGRRRRPLRRVAPPHPLSRASRRAIVRHERAHSQDGFRSRRRRASRRRLRGLDSSRPRAAHGAGSRAGRAWSARGAFSSIRSSARR